MAAEGTDIKALDRRPSLDPHLAFVWDGFVSLSVDRQQGMAGPSGIPFLSIDGYAKRYRVDDIDHFDRFKALICLMDSAYLKWISDQTAKGSDKNGNA